MSVAPYALRALLAAAVLAALGAGGCKKTDEMVDYSKRTPSPEPVLAQKGGPVKVQVDSKEVTAPVSCVGKPEKRLGEEKAKGTFRGVQVGDGTKIIFGREGQGVAYLEVPDDAVAHFVLTHKKEKLEVTYDVLERCVENAGGYLRVLRVRDASAGEMTLARWRERVAKEPALAEAARKAFQMYVDGPFKQ